MTGILVLVVGLGLTLVLVDKVRQQNAKGARVPIRVNGTRNKK